MVQATFANWSAETAAAAAASDRHVRGWPSNGAATTMTPSEVVDWDKSAIVAP